MRAAAHRPAQSEPPSCDSEPIHVPGSIQPHGLLLLFDAGTGTLVHWAGDSGRFLGFEPAVGASAANLLGAPLCELIGSRSLRPGEEAVHLGRVRPRSGTPLAMLAHRTGRFVAIELQAESDGGTAASALEQVRSISNRISASPNLTDACSAAADQVRSITGFDRVMVYRFLDDASGSVIGESRTDGSTAFLHHRFPASDIPRQARDLYRRNLLRTIPDVDYRPVAIQPDPGRAAIDMSHCSLRSVSPVHIQYLKTWACERRCRFPCSSRASFGG